MTDDAGVLEWTLVSIGYCEMSRALRESNERVSRVVDSAVAFRERLVQFTLSQGEESGRDAFRTPQP